VKRLVLTVAMVSLLAIVATLPTGAGARKSRPWVICTTQWDPSPQSTYRRKPHACDYHERGEPYAHAWIEVTRHVQWHYWNGRRAVGHGKTYISTYGPAPVKIKLSRPQHVCGQKIFTKARFKVRASGDTYRYGISLDKCTR
jgi:hypothetical protein